MARAERAGRRGRLGAGLAVVLLHLGIGYGLLAGLAGTVVPQPQDALKLFRILPDPPPPPPMPPPDRPRPTVGQRPAKAPGGLPTPRAAPTPAAAPPVLVTAAPAAPRMEAAHGQASGAGAGSGGGTGGRGGGPGGFGGGEGDETPPRQIGGRLKWSDYPHRPGDRPGNYVAAVRYRVEADGRIGWCRIDRSSGNPELDETICRLIQRRFRYEPARDADGRAVPSTIVETQGWKFDRDEDDGP